jgi:hypothetical protein
MARIRNIKPEFFLNEDLAELSSDARLAFIGLWTMADHEGRMDDRPKRTRLVLFPYHPNIDMESILCSLASAKFIIRYTVGGERYIQIRNFKKHQYISGKEKEKASTIPGPDKSDTGTIPVSTQSSDTTLHSTDNGQLTTDNTGSCSEPPSDSTPATGVSEIWHPTPAQPFLTHSGPYEVDDADIATWLPAVACNDERGWPLTRLHLKSLLESYQPALDGVAAATEVKKAKAWLLNNPANRKTPQGMPKFLNNWLSKAVNGGKR